MWKPFKTNRISSWPMRDGLYLCTVDVPGKMRITRELFWTKLGYKFIDIRRQEVFNTYEVLKTVEDENIGEYSEQLLSDEFCDRTMYVVAWKPLPEPCKKWKRKKEVSR